MTLPRVLPARPLVHALTWVGCLLVLPLVSGPAIAREATVVSSLSPVLGPDGGDGWGVFLAQATQTPVLTFQTPTFRVAVTQSGSIYRMDVSNRANQGVFQRQAIATFSQDEDFSRFSSAGTYNGVPATYQALVDSNDQLTLQIFNRDGVLIAQEFGVGEATVNLPSHQRPNPIQRTVLAFETVTYATRVFQRAGSDRYFMNIYNRITGTTDQNGVTATVVPGSASGPGQISYVSQGTFGGIPAQYFIRLNANQQGLLEIIANDGQVLLTEVAVTNVTANLLAEDVPPGATQADLNQPYIAAVFGGNETLAQIQTLYPTAFQEDTALGPFIHVGAFANRDLATARVIELSNRGFNARVVYRRVQYR